MAFACPDHLYPHRACRHPRTRDARKELQDVRLDVEIEEEFLFLEKNRRSGDFSLGVSIGNADGFRKFPEQKTALPQTG